MTGDQESWVYRLQFRYKYRVYCRSAVQSQVDLLCHVEQIARAAGLVVLSMWEKKETG